MRKSSAHENPHPGRYRLRFTLSFPVLGSFTEDTSLLGCWENCRAVERLAKSSSYSQRVSRCWLATSQSRENPALEAVASLRSPIQLGQMPSSVFTTHSMACALGLALQRQSRTWDGAGCLWPLLALTQAVPGASIPGSSLQAPAPPHFKGILHPSHCIPQPNAGSGADKSGRTCHRDSPNPA